MRVWDVFPYWRERWAIDARQQLLPDAIHVALIGDRTHRGNPHPTALQVMPAAVRVVQTTLDAEDDWGREAQQRDAARFLLPGIKPDDLVLLCDADELVDPRALPAILEATEAGPVKLKMAHYMCGTRWRHRDWWRHGAACRARDLPEHPTADLRMNFALPKVPDAGWHLTYFGTDEDVDLKLSAFAHAEIDTAQTREDLRRFRVDGLDGWVDDPLAGPLADLLAVAA